MSGSAVVTLGAIAITGTFCAIVLRQQTPELSLILALVTGCLLLWRSRAALVAVMDLVDQLSALAGLSRELMEPLVKTVGISILVRIAAQFCRDGGMGGVAVLLELAGSLAALAAVTPLVRGVMELIGSLM